MAAIKQKFNNKNNLPNPLMPSEGGVTPHDQELFNNYEMNVMESIYDPRASELILEGLGRTGDAAKDLLNTSYSVINKVKQVTTQKEGKKLKPEMTTKVANMAVAELAELQSKAGVGETTQEEREGVLQFLLGNMVKTAGRQGAIRPEAMLAFIDSHELAEAEGKGKEVKNG